MCISLRQVTRCNIGIQIHSLLSDGFTNGLRGGCVACGPGTSLGPDVPWCRSIEVEEGNDMDMDNWRTKRRREVFRLHEYKKGYDF